MKGVFVDTGFWVAFIYPSDALHSVAKGLAKTVSGRDWITSDLVISEVLNQFAGAGVYWRSRAADYVLRHITQNPRVKVTESTPELLDRAIGLYSRRPDKEWGLTDCVSFLIMEEEQMADALAYNHHFEQAGFVAMMRTIE